EASAPGHTTGRALTLPARTSNTDKQPLYHSPAPPQEPLGGQHAREQQEEDGQKRRPRRRRIARPGAAAPVRQAAQLLPRPRRRRFRRLLQELRQLRPAAELAAALVRQLLQELVVGRPVGQLHVLLVHHEPRPRLLLHVVAVG